MCCWLLSGYCPSQACSVNWTRDCVCICLSMRLLWYPESHFHTKGFILLPPFPCLDLLSLMVEESSSHYPLALGKFLLYVVNLLLQHPLSFILFRPWHPMLDTTRPQLGTLPCLASLVALLQEQGGGWAGSLPKSILTWASVVSVTGF